MWRRCCPRLTVAAGVRVRYKCEGREAAIGRSDGGSHERAPLRLPHAQWHSSLLSPPATAHPPPPLALPLNLRMTDVYDTYHVAFHPLLGSIPTRTPQCVRWILKHTDQKARGHRMARSGVARTVNRRNVCIRCVCYALTCGTHHLLSLCVTAPFIHVSFPPRAFPPPCALLLESTTFGAAATTMATPSINSAAACRMQLTGTLDSHSKDVYDGMHHRIGTFSGTDLMITEIEQ